MVKEKKEWADGFIRQYNKGKWEFQLADEIVNVILEVHLPRFLDTSLQEIVFIFHLRLDDGALDKTLFKMLEYK
ncbi:hypothetical protein P3T76_015380 [Phytophthora citrophthora]|uniref:Dynein axonemal assembly factor 11-like CS domain-containing protein n=1 Tax=Phytophthora citrophthora TaxID=4793 RepID=A0AAD9FZH4_9STRA|nr:hypothetical protein P3T76_015380 [Phytophthora citrophthora]